MSEHLSENLPRLLTGEANRDEVMAAAAHLRSCPDCQQELVSAVVAHASLTSAHRFAPDIVAPDKSEVPVDQAPARPLPDMSSVFQAVREEAATPRPERSGPRRRVFAVAAAAVVLAGGGVVIAETVGTDTSNTRTIRLDAFGLGTHAATATIVGDRTMRIDATALPRLDGKHSYEVWLTDDRLSDPQPVGLIGNDNRAQLTISPKVMSQHDDIVVSVQPANQTQTYSRIGVLRGSYS